MLFLFSVSSCSSIRLFCFSILLVVYCLRAFFSFRYLSWLVVRHYFVFRLYLLFLFGSRGNRLPLYCLFLGGIFFSLLVIQCLSSFCNGFSLLTCPFYIFSLSVLFRLRHAFLKFFARSFEIFFSLCDSVLCGYWEIFDLLFSVLNIGTYPIFGI